LFVKVRLRCARGKSDTRVFDTLIIVVILIGLALAAVRLYRDFTRPLPPERAAYPEETERHD
jgi:cytochrome c oxidase assembly protein Cox11